MSAIFQFIEKQQVLERVVRWLQSPQNVPRSFRRIFTMMYIGLIAATVIYLNLGAQNAPTSPLEEPAVITALLVALMGIELFEHNRYGLETPRPVDTLLLIARIFLLALITHADESGISLFLYPIIPFLAYFSYGLRVSNLMGGICFVVCFWQVTQMTSAWHTRADVLTLLIIATELLIFMQAMATAIHRDEESRRYTDRLLAELATAHQQLQHYAGQIAELAAAEERNRLARDIHDSLGHHLTVINIQLEKAQAYKTRNPNEADQALVDAKQAARAALEDVRRSVGTLRETDGFFSLENALHGLVDRMIDAPFSIDLHVSGSAQGYPQPALIALYRAAQEGLTNVQKHANARHACLDVYLGPQEARLRLTDDGQGFASTASNAVSSGYGLQGLRERLALTGGTINLHCPPEGGTQLDVVVPKQSTAARTDIKADP
ncbi:MAG: sensor histidine kinase [Anaerolineae bacterium]|nr:sensor histidine kinase [Anaerolineae bacterium]